MRKVEHLQQITTLYRSLAGCGENWQRGMLHIGLIADREAEAIQAGISQQEITAHVEAELKAEMTTTHGTEGRT